MCVFSGLIYIDSIILLRRIDQNLEKTLESALDCKDNKPVNPKRNQPWTFFERTVVEAGAPILWPPDAKSSLIGKNSNAGKDWRQKEKGAAEDKIVR